MKRVAALLLALGLAPVALRAQAASPAWGLFSARFDTRTSDFIYAVYGYGDTFGMMAVLHNPRSGYGEVLGAVGRRFRIGGGPAQFTAVGVAHATEAWYAQVYYLPAVHAGPAWVRATSEIYLPLERAGTVQFALSPASATLGIARRLEAGIALDLSVAQDAALSTAIGPELRLSLPTGYIGTDIQKVIGGSGGRLRLFLLTSF